MKNETGFTLVEILIALALTAMIATAILGSLQFSTRAWEIGYRHSKQTDAIAITQNLIRNQLANLPYVNDNPDLEKRITGSADHLTILSYYPRHLSGGGVNVYHYQIVDGSLILKWHPLQGSTASNAENSTEPQAEIRTLIQHIERGGFSFHGLNPETKALGWLSGWDRKVALPGLVKADFSFSDESPDPLWPEFMAQPRLRGAPPIYNIK